MRKFIALCLILLGQSSLMAATFSIDMGDSSAAIEPGGTYVFEAYIHNLTDQPLMIKATRVENSIPDGWTTTICLGSTCYAPFISEAQEVVFPGDSLFFDITFLTDTSKARGSAVMKFQDLGGGDSTLVRLSVSTEPQPSFRITLNDTLAVQPAGKSCVLDGYIFNTATKPLQMKMSRLENDLPQGWNSTLCLGATCYAPGISEISDIIQPGDSLYFDVTVNTQSSADTGRVKVRFEDTVTGDFKEYLLTAVSTVVKPALALDFPDTSVSGPAGSELISEGYIHNLTDSTITVNIIRLQNQIPVGWTSALCLEVCFAPFVNEITETIERGDSLIFSLHFFTDTTAASGSSLVAFNVTGSSDTLYQHFIGETQATAIDGQNHLLADKFHIAGNYPNPFNNQTTIEFTAPARSSRAILEVFNPAGQNVYRQKISALAAGRNRLRFDGSSLNSGLYYYRITLLDAGLKRLRAVHKFVLLK